MGNAHNSNSGIGPAKTNKRDAQDFEGIGDSQTNNDNGGNGPADNENVSNNSNHRR